MLATKHIFIIKVKQNELSLKRVMKISQMGGITKRSGQESQQFILHIKNEHDYLLETEQTQLYIEFV